jgi:uncharacterized protein DUF4238
LIENLTEEDFNEFRLLALRTLMDSVRVGTILTNMIWTVMLRYGSYPLFTSDRPIWITQLGQENAHLVLPLPPDHIFVAARNSETLDRIEQHNLYDGLAERINNRVVRQARRYVYAVNDARQAFMTHRLGDRESWSGLERPLLPLHPTHQGIPIL